MSFEPLSGRGAPKAVAKATHCGLAKHASSTASSRYIGYIDYSKFVFEL